MNKWLKDRLNSEDIKPLIEQDNWQGVYDVITNGKANVYDRNAAILTAFLIDELEFNPVDELTKLYRRQFVDVSSLKKLLITENIQYVDSYVLLDSTIEHVTLCSKDTYLEPGAFAKSPLLKTASLPYNMTTFPSSLFYESGLVTFEFPSHSIEVGRYMFYNCSNLTTVKLSNQIKIIRFGAFENCTSLQTITIPNSVEYITPEAFEGCTSLTEIIFEKGSKIQLDEDSLPTGIVVKCSKDDISLIESMNTLNIMYEAV